jgi:tRNA-splicing ligase RtcB
MKINRVLAPWKGDKRFTAMAKRAVELKKSGLSDEAVAAQIGVEFGQPTALEQLRDGPQPHTIYGVIGEDIEAPALAQLTLALRLPIAVRGALMPDAHPGYALPIGGVFAAHRAVAPAMVGVDIGCRMHLTIFDLEPDELLKRRAALLADLQAVTAFGLGVVRERKADHEVLDDPRWALTSQLRGLRAKAEAQLGTSGGGNHFAELVIGERLSAEGAAVGVPERFCGLLTHSGSRGVGFSIANGYMRLAAQETARVAEVPKFYEWLDLDSEAGQEYWQAMELACAFARANHEVIHASLLRRSKLTAATVIENHHNFAEIQGDEVIHRKGATPAGPGVLGVIPGSMASPSYIVAGRGVAASLNSASHGAGRRGSRTAAKNSIAIKDVHRLLKEQDVLVEGLSVDEAPQAYKDIERVMQIQVEAGLIEPLARMRPVAVIMSGDKGED